MILSFLIFSVICIQDVLSCYPWVFPMTKPIRHITETCCQQKFVGGVLYNYNRTQNTSEWGCPSDCVYSTVNVTEDHFCFKPGNLTVSCAQIQEGNVTIPLKSPMKEVFKCVSPNTTVIFKWSDLPSGQNCLNFSSVSEHDFNSCNITTIKCNESPFIINTTTKGTFYFAGDNDNCSSGMKAKIIVDNSCSKVEESNRTFHAGLAKLNDDFADMTTVNQALNNTHHKQNISTAIADIEGMGGFLTLEQREALQKLSRCDPTREICDKCFEELTITLAQCVLYNQSMLCNQDMHNSNSTCFACLCKLSQTYIPSLKCPKAERYETKHHCDRNCANSKPFKCVFNLTLEMLDTDADGRRADGRPRTVLTYNKTMPGPTIVICVGDELVIHLKNDISNNMANSDVSGNATTLHLHGIREKNRPWSDGVPFVTQCPILPGESFSYGLTTTNVKAENSGLANDVGGATPGTYWYHSHVGSQRTNGAYGALIIKENTTAPNNQFESNFDVDSANNTLLLQEWYHSATDHTPASILINGTGRVGENITMKGSEEVTSNYREGKGAVYKFVRNEHYQANFTTNYPEYTIDHPGKRYRFRIIGAISQNFPLRLSIDEHHFTAIAADSSEIEPVEYLTDLWLASGERFDIVIKTKEQYEYEDYENGTAYKIRVFGFSDPGNKRGSFCTIAWLKYPNQKVDYSYVTDSSCTGFNLTESRRTLNPVPNYNSTLNKIKFPDWRNNSTCGRILIKDTRATFQHPSIYVFGRENIKTSYIEFVGNNTFNNTRMDYSDIPVLLQTEKNKKQCGSKCDINLNTSGDLTKKPYFTTNCSYKTAPSCKPGEFCKCQHVLERPYAPGYWAELVLVNNMPDMPAHPIHKHGGWFWVLGTGVYNHNINRTFIIEEDTKCSEYETKKTRCLPRNYILPPAKDTVQVPPGGYAILRIPLDNAGTWLIHCHINFHTLVGMAMVFQIGGYHKDPKFGQKWCNGPLKTNTSCNTHPPPPNGGPVYIYWFLYMEPAKRCVTPGTNVTFIWLHGNDGLGHTVQQLNKTQYNNCEIKINVTKPLNGDYVWSTQTIGTNYFACGRGNGYHCRHGMKATIVVSDYCD